MATTGSLVRALNYNTIQADIAQILGPGTGLLGVGQSVSSSQVGASTDIVEALDWAQLKIDILKMANSQGSETDPAITALPDITSGDIIEANDVVLFQNALAVINNNLYNLAEFSDELLITGTRTTSWNSTIRHFFTLDFGSGENARYFFNSGSSIRIIPNLAKSSSTSINNDWETILNTIGAVNFDYDNTQGTGSQPGTGSSIGFYNLTTTFQQIFTKTSSLSVYSANDYTIRARCDIANNTAGGARYVYFECYFRDDKGANPNFDESVTGTTTNVIRMHRASGSNVNVTGPTLTETVLLSAAQT